MCSKFVRTSSSCLVDRHELLVTADTSRAERIYSRRLQSLQASFGRIPVASRGSTKFPPKNTLPIGLSAQSLWAGRRRGGVPDDSGAPCNRGTDQNAAKSRNAGGAINCDGTHSY